MKKLITIILSIGTTLSFAQTYSGSGGAISDDNTANNFTTTVCNSETSLGGSISIDAVCLDISHTWLEDLDIFLVDPCGNRLELSTDNGGSGDNYTNTCFNDAGADGAITAGTPPFTGTYIPEGSFATLNGFGCDPNGTWTLEITDDLGAIAGTLNGWSMQFGGSGTACQPNDDCIDAISLSTGTTCTTVSGSNDGSTSSGDPSPSCWDDTPDNTVWYSFVPDSSQVEIDMRYAVSGGLTDNHLAVYSGSCGSLTEVACNEDFNDGFNELSWVQAFGLTPGDTYYIMVDGNNNEEGGFSVCVTDLPSSPPPVDGQDCATSTTLCDEALTYTTSTIDDGFGTQELSSSNSCWGAGGERQSIWYNFIADAGGTLSMFIASAVDDDIDWALYHMPTGDCSSDITAANELSCDWSGETCSGGTGMSDDPNAEFGVDVGCMGGQGAFSWEPEVTITAGETYALIIDNFDQSNNGFSLTFGGTATFFQTTGLCVTPLSLEFLKVVGKALKMQNRITWQFEDEGIDYYVVEKSNDGKLFNAVEKISVDEYYNESNGEFTYLDRNISSVVSYYRVRAVKKGEGKKYSDIVEIDRRTIDRNIESYFDITGKQIQDLNNYRGVYFIKYDDNTLEKQIK